MKKEPKIKCKKCGKSVSLSKSSGESFDAVEKEDKSSFKYYHHKCFFNKGENERPNAKMSNLQ